MQTDPILRLRDLPPGSVFQTKSEHPQRAVTTRWTDASISTVLCVEIDRYPGNLESLPGSMPVERLGTFRGGPDGVLNGAAYTPNP